MPLTPIATLTMPLRHGRPNESVMMTPISASPAIPASSRSRIRAADASGSSGSSDTVPSAMFEPSTPALAQMKP
jgi:hypothetical protein